MILPNSGKMKMTSFGRIIYKPGDLLLVAFPFSSQAQTKVRPVVVLSTASYNRLASDVVVCGVTSNLDPTRFSIRIDQANLAIGFLKAPSKIKVDAIAAVEKTIIIKKIGRLDKDMMNKIKLHLRARFAL